MFITIINSISSFYPTGLEINKVLGLILSAIFFHKFFYFLLGMFFTRKFKPAKTKHKFGICIAARNEEAVLGNLIDSINKQFNPVKNIL